jgi:plasmid stability protein
MSRDPRPADRVGLRLELSAAYRDRLRVIAARSGRSMATYLRQLVEAHIEAVDPAPKPKGKKRRSEDV